MLITQGDSLNRVPNGFSRKSTSTKLIFIRKFTFSNVIRSISLVSDSEVYIFEGNLRELSLLNLNKDGVEYTPTGISDSTIRKLGRSYFTAYLKPKLFIFAYNQNKLYRLDLGSKKVDVFTKPGSLYIRAVLLTESEIGVREYNDSTGDCEFGVWHLLKNTVESRQQSMRYFHDGGINTDGKLIFDRSLGKALYVPYYYDSIYVLDNSMSTINRFGLIDTNKSPKIKIRLSRNFETSGGASFVLNRTFFFDENEVGVVSRLKGDNQTVDFFQSNEVIDIYDIRNGTYKYSQSIPKRKDEVINIIKKGDFYICGSAHEVTIWKLE